MTSEGRTAIRGVELDWSRAGAGRPLIWGHGLSSSRADEDTFGLVDWSVVQGLDLLRYDARGHGLSGLTAEPTDYSWEQLALDQLGLATSMGIDQYIAAGASMGAATALHAAVAAPDRIDALVLVIPPTGWETRADQVALYEQMAGIVEAGRVELLVSGIADAPVPGPLLGRDDWVQRRVSSLRSADPERLAAVFRGAGTADLPTREALATISTPALILAWSGDPGHPETTAEVLVDVLPDAHCAVASTWDEMQTWGARIAEFVGGLPA